MGQFEAGPAGTPAEGTTVTVGISLALPSRAVRAELEDWHPIGAPFTALIQQHQDGEQCKTMLTVDLAVVLLASLEQFWEERIATLPVDRVDQLQALRADARNRWAAVARHPEVQ